MYIVYMYLSPLLGHVPFQLRLFPVVSFQFSQTLKLPIQIVNLYRHQVPKPLREGVRGGSEGGRERERVGVGKGGKEG